MKLIIDTVCACVRARVCVRVQIKALKKNDKFLSLSNQENVDD